MGNHEHGAYRVTQFCDAHGISRASFYLLDRQGKAPRTFSVGKRRLISKEAAAAWRRAREKEEATPARRRVRAAIRKQARKAQAEKARKAQAAAMALEG